ncbi:hypothetical protein [Paenibacillus polymyxa]|uniref:hypothetical protein n=1 Tax=Paenibacillus polymyxa TaxID=1406 RepID=UPI00083D3A23|nr:hypothetical protein [Paenibacillus polymyxa]ODB60580.1 hypothetical protein A7309_17330 [Paenibacillus polymyxa]
MDMTYTLPGAFAPLIWSMAGAAGSALVLSEFFPTSKNGFFFGEIQEVRLALNSTQKPAKNLDSTRLFAGFIFLFMDLTSAIFSIACATQNREGNRGGSSPLTGIYFGM